jgi:NAD(P)-dependent dehydrogenase (short-subunit alcohol dehydrogenase family)
MRHVLVIGGTRGLGKTFAAMARSQEWRVTIASRSAATVPAEGYYRCDVSKPDEIGSLVTRLPAERGRITSLVFFQRFRGDGDAWEGELATSLRAPREFLKRTEELFEPQNAGSVVLVSSVNAFMISGQLEESYHVAKAGMCQLARYFAVTLGRKNIRVNAVCPGTFVKPESEARYGPDQELGRRLAQASPLNRMCTAKNVADVIYFLQSDAAAFITGQSLVVDGGISLQWQETLIR